MRYLTTKLRQTAVKDTSPYKIGKALLRLFEDYRPFAAFCYDDGVFATTGHNLLAIRKNASIDRFVVSVTELYLTADAKCDYQFSQNPKIYGAFKDYLKIFKGQGDYNTIIGSKDFEELLTVTKDPYTSYNILNGRTSFRKQPETKPDKPETKPDKPETKPDKPETKPDKPLVCFRFVRLCFRFVRTENLNFKVNKNVIKIDCF